MQPKRADAYKLSKLLDTSLCYQVASKGASSNGSGFAKKKTRGPGKKKLAEQAKAEDEGPAEKPQETTGKEMREELKETPAIAEKEKEKEKATSDYTV